MEVRKTALCSEELQHCFVSLRGFLFPSSRREVNPIKGQPKRKGENTQHKKHQKNNND